MRWSTDDRAGVRAFGLMFGAIGLMGALALRAVPRLVERLAFCPLRTASGIPCPTCGGTHAALALAHLHLTAALSDNALVTLAVLCGTAWVLYALLASVWPRLRGQPVLTSREWQLVRVLLIAAIVAQWAWSVAHRGA